MKIYSHEELPQGEQAWLDIRKGKLTSSHATAVATAKTGLKTYCYEIVLKMFSSGENEGYTNEHMQRGNDLEDEARAIFELETGHKVVQVGFIEENERIGSSPDGLIDDDGLIEIKCKSDKNFVEQAIEGVDGIESNYRWQMQDQMLVSGRKWCYFVCYNPNFKEPLLIYRIERDEEMIEKLKLGKIKGVAMINEYVKKFNGRT